jgi:hypothetical protein
MRHGRTESVAFLIGADPQNSGMVLSSAAMKRFKPNREYRRARLLVNGKRIPASPVGVGTADGMPALFLRFDPAPVLRAHPDGFNLALAYSGRNFFTASINDAGPSFQALGRCAARLPR